MKTQTPHASKKPVWTADGVIGAPACVGKDAFHRVPIPCKQGRGGTRPYHACRRSAQRAYLLIEALVYIAVIVALLGVGYAAMYRCVDSSLALRRNADDIASALHAGERWRADVRAATTQVRAENTDAGQHLYLEGARGTVTYRFATNAVLRSVNAGPWLHVLSSVKSSTMTTDKREYVTAWRWELELQTHAYGSVKPGRVRPLFTFIAVPERLATR